MHCLVTGASGFIGRILSAELVKSGHRVTGLFRNRVDGPWTDHFLFDLGSNAIPDELLSGVDVIYHLAGIAHDIHRSKYNEADYQRINVQATVDLARQAGLSGAQHFIHFSSVKAVADPGEICVDESWDAWPADIYGRSKREAEEALLELHKAGDCAVTILRPALVYGPGVKGNLAQMVNAIRLGYFPPLPETGNRRSLIHVLDLVDVAQRLTLQPLAYGKTYIASEQEPYSTRKMYENICRSLDKPVAKWAIPVAVLRSLARVGDRIERFTGRQCPVSQSMIDRLLGSACYQSKLLTKDFDWKSVRTQDIGIR